MSRRLAGIFDPGGSADASQPARALDLDRAGRFESGGLALAYSGPPAAGPAPLCLFDGHLDNAGFLRRELGRGDDAGEESVEALLAAAYRRWGAGLPERLRGDFALLIWDGEREAGLLARDQLGVRPLFVHERGGVLRFAGELRDLLALLPATPPPDRAGVAHWIALSSRPGTATLYQGVRRLGPGELLRFGRDGAVAHRYWEPRFCEPLSLPAGQLAKRVLAGLETAVERRLGAAGRAGVLMSGGLDSSSIAALAGDRAAACSGVFPEHQAADEAELIEQLRGELGLSGLVAEVRPGGLLASALEYLAAWRAPLLGWGDFWTLPLLRAAAARGVGTVLDGDGGDELFGPRVYLLADRLRGGHPREVLALARRLPGAGSHVGPRQEAGMIARLALAGSAPSFDSVRRRIPLAPGQAPGWLRRGTVAELIASDAPGAWKRLDGPRWWANAAYGIAYGIEQTGMFEHQRRRAALAGIEARHPMLDLDLVELCLRQPPEQTLDPRFSRPVLREAMAGLLPDSVRLRPGKALFESLIVSCLTGPDGGAVRGILTAVDAEVGAYVDLAKMKRALFGDASILQRDPFRWMWQVWRLLNAELWLRSQAVSFRLPEPNMRLSEAKVSIQPA